jgi:hypothetical protein
MPPAPGARGERRGLRRREAERVADPSDVLKRALHEVAIVRGRGVGHEQVRVAGHGVDAGYAYAMVARKRPRHVAGRLHQLIAALVRRP